MQRSGDDFRRGALRPSTVLKLSEAAWVIARQASLASLLQLAARAGSLPDVERVNVTRWPAYRDGYDLAERTRRMLGLDPEAPIPSMRALLEETLGITLLQQHLPARLAGATLSNGGCRGIIVNLDGWNEDPWVRRATVAHEFCHFLWDAEQSLDRLRVDSYDELNPEFFSDQADAVEQRANAFAVEFLAPRSGVRRLAAGASSRAEALSRVMDHYGISATAAGHQLDNSGFVPTWKSGGGRPTAQPSDDWMAAENFTSDIFPIAATSMVRRGQFALLAAKARQAELISSDTGAMLLECIVSEFDEKLDLLLSLAPDAAGVRTDPAPTMRSPGS